MALLGGEIQGSRACLEGTIKIAVTSRVCLYLKYIIEEKHAIKGLDFAFIMLPVFPILSVLILKTPDNVSAGANTVCSDKLTVTFLKFIVIGNNCKRRGCVKECINPQFQDSPHNYSELQHCNSNHITTTITQTKTITKHN